MCAQQLVHAQIFQLAAARFNNNNLQNIPRFSWAFPIDFPVAKLSDKGYVLSGIVLKNEGFIVNVDSSIYNARKPGTENTNRFKTNRYKFRTISIGPNVGISYALNENLAIYAQYGVDWNFNYKEKRFGDKKRSNKEIVRSEASSQRINVLNHYVALGIGLRSGPYIFGQYYFRNFFNQKFQETVIVNGNSTLIRPYENLNVTRFNVGISFFTVIKKKE
ncbi:MAG: hypothetical protein RML94_08960 [Bacteroidia bacterium]|nr:hypothetical protein [Bacteroidia bacterium]